MALQVIGAGYGRTGTMSLQHALNELGFPCYHMSEVLTNRANKGHVAFWREVADDPTAERSDWDRVFANYTAAVDNPAVAVWPELLRANPDAKVVLTQHPRGPEAWYQSVLDTIYFTEQAWQFRVLRAVLPFARTFGDMGHLLIWQHLHRGTMVDQDRAVARYRAHLEEVKAAVPADRLLEYSVDQGWEPLCAFLGVPVPATPFPNVNDRATQRKVNRATSAVAYAILGVIGLGATAALLGLRRALRRR